MSLVSPAPRVLSGISRALRRPSTRLVAGAAALACFGAPLVTAPAYASAYPAKPSGLKLAGATRTSLTVTAANSQNARSYTLYASTDKTDLYYSHLTHGQHTSNLHSASATNPKITISGLSYTTDVVYWRFEANNGSRHSYSTNIHEAGLRPSTPSSLGRSLSGADSATLTWKAESQSTGFEIRQANDPGMTQGVTTYTVGQLAGQFVPYRVTPGDTYYFQIRAITNGTGSDWTSPTAENIVTHHQAMKIATYNILQTDTDGTMEPGGRISPWSQRGPAQAALIKHVDPDVLTINEGNDWVGSVPGTRQVDSLRNYLAADGENYTVANTEVTWAQKLNGVAGFQRTGSYILYKPSVYSPVGNGGHFDLGDAEWGAYQELRNNSTGAKVLVVAAHLKHGAGAAADDRRLAEARSLISQTQRVAQADGVPVIYGGDFNSSPNGPGCTYDAAGEAMTANGVNNAKFVAQHLTNADYDSMNEYQRAPWAYGIDIDYIWATPGVAVAKWGMAMPLSHGKFVGAIPSDHNPVYATVYYSY